MAKLNARARGGLPDSAFAYIDSRGRRRLPINDEAHVRNALARFNQVGFEDDAARQRARERLLKAAKKYGIIPIGFINGQLQSERRESNRILRELKEAQKIQANLLPGRPPDVSNFELSGVSLPSRSVGGDWYDFISLPDGHVAVVLADVSGKGMGAALLMSSTRSVVRMVAESVYSPGAVLAEVNRVLVTDLPRGTFVTMIYAVLDPHRRVVTFATAGHLPPILATPDGARALKHKSQLALGIRDGQYVEHEVKMSTGDRFVLYSDGVVEARNPSAEDYGTTRLLHQTCAASASSHILLDDVRVFMGKQPATDDITIVTIRAL